MSGETETTDESLKPPKDLASRDDISLLVLSGPCAGQYFKVPDQGGVIGRDADADIRLADPGTSREHAELKRGADGFFEITDLESRYGTYVEGVRTDHARLVDGDRVQISGETVFRVRYQDERESEVLARMHDSLTRDELTSVYSRRYFLERLESEYAYARRHRAQLGLLMVDVDYFKRINDQHGHVVGDEVLGIVGKRLKDTVRAEDLVGRYGGDELIICVRGLTVDEAEAFGKRLTNVIRSKPAVVGTLSFHLSVSVGVAGLVHPTAPSLMELVTRADSALYEAKRQGRDRVAVWARQNT